MKNKTRLIDYDKFIEPPCDSKTLEIILKEGILRWQCPQSTRDIWISDCKEIGYTGPGSNGDIYLMPDKTKEEKRSYSTTLEVPWGFYRFSNEMKQRVKDIMKGGSRIIKINCNAFSGYLMKHGMKLTINTVY